MKSPYLKNDQRLADVIAAIQVLGTYKRYKLDYAGWNGKISGTKRSPEYWEKIFNEHPEFFRINSDEQKASLVWRRSQQRTYRFDTNKILTREECDSLDDEERDNKLSRVPLNNDDISMLIETAINLHTRAIESEKEKRWILPSLITLLAVAVGALL